MLCRVWNVGNPRHLWRHKPTWGVLPWGADGSVRQAAGNPRSPQLLLPGRHPLLHVLLHHRLRLHLQQAAAPGPVSGPSTGAASAEGGHRQPVEEVRGCAIHLWSGWYLCGRQSPLEGGTCVVGKVHKRVVPVWLAEFIRGWYLWGWQNP